MIILYSFLAVAVLGGLFGIGLAVAAKALAVEKDDRILAVEAALPGANCGGCGYAGCAAYAEAIVKEDADITLCAPGGAAVARAIAEIMGISVEVSDQKMVAMVHCRGNRDTCTYKFDYNGIRDCNALYALYGGDKTCSFGCLGLGSCMKVCPVDAIDYDSRGNVVVDRDVCISCGKCVDVCPTGVMKMVPYSADYIVACHSIDKGALVRKYCTVGCIGCKMCEKKSPEGGFTVEDFLARIDYDARGSRDEAAAACPPKCILRVSSLKPDLVPVTALQEENEEA
ncbi:MAG: RnfABCDGE type electron transport complex subunit B [Spirochaetales bacterium]|nr:RnfABCDGE type electron transport complex subunit B [Spirochaetales bacterium]